MRAETELPGVGFANAQGLNQCANVRTFAGHVIFGLVELGWPPALNGSPTFGKNYDLRYGENISASDLQSSPTILIGGFSNAWSLEVMHQLPFRLTAGDQIIDSHNKGRFWKRKNEPGTVHGDDYAVITRLVRAETGNFVLDIAGIDT